MEVRSSGKMFYGYRSYALRNWILPQYIADPYIDEVIVVGDFEEGEGYQYVPCPSVKFNWSDCIAQRHEGFLASSGDVVIFQHDDHVFDKNSSNLIWARLGLQDVLSPARYTRLRKVEGERLNAGEPAIAISSGPPFNFEENYPGKVWRVNDPKSVVSIEGYIDGHGAIYRREVIKACPWNEVPKQFTMDVLHTAQIREKGFKIVWTDDIKIFDVEFGAQPWK